MIRIQNVLVATDFSETSDAALDYGREMARTFGSTLHVLHVADSVNLPYGGEAYTAMVPDLQAEVEEAARNQLQALLEHEDSALHIRPVVVAAISPAAAIVDYAVQHQIDSSCWAHTAEGRSVICSWAASRSAWYERRPARC